MQHMETSISPADLAGYEEDFLAKHDHLLAMNTVTKNGINNSALTYDAMARYPHAFSIEVESGDVCDQKKSGRCWMFASLNVMRLTLMQKLNLPNTELSQSYPFFYDKLEKSNYFLENILETLEEQTGSRILNHLLADPVGDGGQWDMFRSIVAKYGVVPKDCYPETAASSNSMELRRYLTMQLRSFAHDLRKAAAEGTSMEGLREMKNGMMNKVYRMLCISLGKPPVRFTWETRDKDGKFIRISDITPQDFFKEYIGWDLDEYVTVINAPTADKPYGRTFTVQYLGNVKGGKYPVKYLNLPMDDLRDITIRQLQAGEVVWFGSDAGKFSYRDGGLFTTDAFDIAGLLDIDFPMDKAERLDYCDSLMTHAMVITGVDLDENGRPIRWKVENSWGKEPGKNGYYVMSDKWFGEYSYQILLNRRYLSPEQAAAFDTEPIVLAPWDPMGSLAD